ncbi:MAG: tRNA lysidine(34) synthetase TilS [Clostridia bacterium]|nr:tRNA lysidine(34) synthetase TilS [Clostridia bacterium]
MRKFDGFFGKRVCVAISGGVDSTALLHYLKTYEKEVGFSLSAVHCEHGIRGEESISDQAFVCALCKKWNVPLLLFSEDCPKKAKREKTSLETAARNFRLESFSSLVKENKVDFIATAHHVSDEAETVLFRLARGTALSGVKGMEKRSGYFIRPFLDWTKEEILSYAEKNGLSYRTDSTNLEMDATRNKLRLTVFPALEEAMRGAIVNLARFARLASEDDALLNEQSKALLSLTPAGKTLVKFSGQKPLFRRACLMAIKALGVEKDYTSTHLESVYSLQQSERGARICLPQGVIAQKGETGIEFFLRSEEEILPPAPQAEIPFSLSGFDGGRYAVNVSSTPIEVSEGKILRVDKDKIPENAVFRFRREGDAIQSFGGGKSLKKFFNEKKIPAKERAFLPLITEKDGSEVLVVCGVEISERVKITEETQSVLYITLQRKGEVAENGGSTS